MKKTFVILASGVMFSSTALASGNPVRDHYRSVIVKKPYSVEVCTQGNGKTDLENFITGALIGGAIGNNIPGEKGGGAIGGILGGALNTEKNKGNQCVTETRYEEERVQVYSHTTVTFDYQGRQYTLNFKK